MATPYSSDSQNDINITTLKGLFAVADKVDSLPSSELRNSKRKPQGLTQLIE